MREKINRYFSSHKEEMYMYLKGLMEIESRTENREKSKEALAYVLRLAEKFGMKTTMGKYGDVGVVEIGQGDVTLGILAHVDVVPEGDLSAWEVRPFTLTRKNDTLYGRGIVDDKGPVITSLYAMRFVKENLPEMKKKIQLIVGTSEESIWTDMVHFKEEFSLPDYGYSPDGNFPIYYAENGYMDLILDFSRELGEEYDNLTGGSAENSVPSSAGFSYRGKPYEIKGKAAHSSTPELGENALLKMGLAMPEPKPDFARFLNKYFPEGEYASRLSIEKDRSKAFDGEASMTTIVPTLLRQKGRRVSINFNVRQAIDIPNENIIAAFEREKQEYSFEIRIKESLAPIYVDKNQPWILRMREAYESYGKKNEFLLASGCTYAKTIPNFVSWGPVFPEDLDCAHMENEQATEESFILGAKIYTTYLLGEAQREKA